MKKYGFTLFEMLIVIIILSFVGGIGSIIIYNGFKASLKSRDIIDATWQPQSALQRMSDDIGEIRSRFDLNIGSTSQFTFTTISGNTITYVQSGNFLQRTFNSVAKNMVDGIASLRFAYYDANNVLATSALAVRCIKVTATISKNNTNTNLQTVCCPRNLL
jgi:prepilin-type N-terminal cleavage/methylation domain-containing protein